MPGQIGNMAIAGHRTTHGHPFFDLDALVEGDVVIIETRQSYVVYRMARSTVVRPPPDCAEPPAMPAPSEAYSSSDNSPVPAVVPVPSAPLTEN